MSNSATIEIFINGKWTEAATLTSHYPEDGYKGQSELEYDPEYTRDHLKEGGKYAISCDYELTFYIYESERWPAFVLDLLPNGYGRDIWRSRLDLPDNASADWALLLNGAASPPGNLRIKEAAGVRDPDLVVPDAQGALTRLREHPGFTFEEVISKQEHFLEYAHQNGAYAAGASDVQGAAPKFLLVKDHHGQFHAEGALADDKIAEHYLIKFPRGNKSADDRMILRSEAGYLEVARALGLRTGAPLHWEWNALLIPRFDRVVDKGGDVHRLGMESLCSLAGVTDYQAEIPQNELCEALAKHSRSPTLCVSEFVKRDVANVVMGNKDNHARNNAVLKTSLGSVALSPLFDFAPMYKDPEGITRICRWSKEAEQAGRPAWAQVVEELPDEVDASLVRLQLKEMIKPLEKLSDTMRDCNVDDEIIQDRQNAITDNLKLLRELK